MKQTEQYGLNQWELADRVRMDDFNSDNRKIDAELTLLRENLFGLAFYIGQQGLLNQVKDFFVNTQYPILTFAFNPGDYYTLEGDITVADNRGTLTGKGATGSLTVSRGPFTPLGREARAAHLWVHFNTGTVTPYLNGKEMREVRSSLFNSPAVKNGWCHEYVLETPYLEHVTLKLELDCGNSDSMTFGDIILAQL